MTQPAKVQEPSMEEILASIRRIIADDEAKPPAAEKPASAEAAAKPEAPAKPEKPAAAAPAAKAPAIKDIPPPAIPATQSAAAKTPPPPARPAPPPPAEPAPVVSNSQDDIDELLNGLDEATTPEEIRAPLPEGEVFELTDEMVLPELPSFQKVEPQDDLEFTEVAVARTVRRQPAFEPPPLESSPAAPPQQMLSRTTVSAVESAFNTLANTVLSNNARTLEDLVKEMLRPMLKSWLDDNLPGLVERIVKAEIERVSRGGR
jgi:cell pole-organizing protein PopZ